MGKVSIIVPVYNGENVLKRCVDSILKQDADDLEVILVNDGSRDGSQAIAEAYAQKDPRVRAIYKENGGVSSARNRGCSLRKKPRSGRGNRRIHSVCGCG